MDNNPDEKKDREFKSFAFKRVLFAVVLVIVVVWALAVGLGYLEKPDSLLGRLSRRQPHSAEQTPLNTTPAQTEADEAVENRDEDHAAADSESQSAESEEAMTARSTDDAAASAEPHATADARAMAAQEKTAEPEAEAAAETAGQPHEPETPSESDAAVEEHAPAPSHEPVAEPERKFQPPGVAFVDATMAPIGYELKHRFYGWRPNDIIDFTDNVNQFQLGVLEVTRRTAVQLTERISRTGSTDAFNPNLENAMNWLMVKADRYWFPSPESKYKESLEELTAYRERLMSGKASFHTRTDNLIPLLAAYEDLLGSCDENLVKHEEADGSVVSFFKADDYFYYARGVASAMGNILKAVGHDFAATIEGRHGAELLHHAITSCNTAASLDPWIIFDGDLDGILANHRAHMAAPISHARFYIGQLIKTLST